MSLRERRDIVELCSPAARVAGVLFTVVRVKGSSYRQPGARMVALQDGSTAGTISGGCLETDLLRRAAWTVRDGAAIEHFSTAFDDAAEIPYGLGCGGEIDVLAEPLDTAESDALLEAVADSLRGEARTVATVLPQLGSPSPVQRFVLDAELNVQFASESLRTESIVEIRSRMLQAKPKTKRQQTFAEDDVYVEWLQPVQRLLIFGAGEDARPVARLAMQIGWQAVVVDTRAHRLGTTRFPGAQCVQASSIQEVPLRADDALVLMTHSYAQDLALLTEALARDTAYLGLLGARHRSALLLEAAAKAAGVSLTQAVDRTHAPVGLDLGGEGPEAVALSIVAEVQQVLGCRTRQGERRLQMSDVIDLLAKHQRVGYPVCAMDDPSIVTTLQVAQ